MATTSKAKAGSKSDSTFRFSWHPTTKGAFITGAAIIAAAVYTAMSSPSRDVFSSPKRSVAAGTPSNSYEGRLSGVVADLSGHPIADMTVSIQNGPTAVTDARGKYVLSGVPTGDQEVVLRSPSGNGSWQQNIMIGADGVANLTFDPHKAKLGLLSIVTPIDDTRVQVHKDRGQFLATVSGRCDGLFGIFDRPDIRVLIKSEADEYFWMQHPGAIIDPTNNTWSATAKIGDTAHPPRDGEHFYVIAVSADESANLRRIESTPDLNLLHQQHLSSNVVSVKVEITR
jgi:hypothetical protein